MGDEAGHQQDLALLADDTPATGITRGDLLEGVSRQGNIAETETLVIRGKSRTIHRIKSIHYLDRKDDDIKGVIL
ncbi:MULTISPECIES: fructose-bisphosphatase class II [unclassified Endozoicomonas]|uniref:fructose-bisphosphatase class II n=1 Tax=unclassified Endozoicomonas TaxID=2644528 RepID=UPI003BB4FC73